MGLAFRLVVNAYARLNFVQFRNQLGILLFDTSLHDSQSIRHLKLLLRAASCMRNRRYLTEIVNVSQFVGWRVECICVLCIILKILR